MECKGCNKPIEGDAYRMVADWAFCLPCFEELRQGRKKKRESTQPASTVRLQAEPAPEPEQVVPAPATAPGAKLCGTCDKPLTASEQGLKLGDVVVCDACRQALIFEPMREIRRKEEAEEAARAAREEAQKARRLAPEDIVPVGVAGSKVCASCDRRLIEPGGYSWVGDKPYCPACAPAAREAAEQAGTPEPANDTVSRAAPSGAPGAAVANAGFGNCEACHRPFVEGRPKATQGFYLCEPCLEVDREGALELARQQHRKRLRALREG